jgi:hypothetical protein
MKSLYVNSMFYTPLALLPIERGCKKAYKHESILTRFKSL